MKKRIVLFLSLLLLIGLCTGCAREPKRIELTMDNYGSYIDWFVTGTGGESMGKDSYYVSEALDDAGYYYTYGTVYGRVEIPFMVKSITEGYTLENGKITFRVKGEVANIYETSNLNSSKRKSKNINETFTIDLKSDLSMNSIICEKAYSVKGFGTPVNDINGLNYWDLDWEMVGISGTLVEIIK